MLFLLSTDPVRALYVQNGGITNGWREKVVMSTHWFRIQSSRRSYI